MIKTPLSTVIGGAFWTPSATILGGTSKTFNQLIKSLFANNEQGFVYDPNDLSTMFRDEVGAVPVTGAGQPVGMMLDKSKGLVRGDELNDPDFKEWVGSGMTYQSGLLSFTNDSGALHYVTARKFPDVPSFIEVELNIVSVSGDILLANQGATAVFVLSEGCTKHILGSGFDDLLLFVVPDGASFTIDYFSIKQVYGNHAYQATSSMRPLLQDTLRRIDYDAVDDKLITNLLTELTGCTVVRAVPNVGTQILTNQTIPTTYNDNTDHCGLIVINRALTASETSAITAEFNKRAGV